MKNFEMEENKNTKPLSERMASAAKEPGTNPYTLEEQMFLWRPDAKDIVERFSKPESKREVFVSFINEFNHNNGPLDGNIEKLGEPKFTKTYTTAWGESYEIRYYPAGEMVILLKDH